MHLGAHGRWSSLRPNGSTYGGGAGPSHSMLNSDTQRLQLESHTEETSLFSSMSPSRDSGWGKKLCLVPQFSHGVTCMFHVSTPIQRSPRTPQHQQLLPHYPRVPWFCRCTLWPQPGRTSLCFSGVIAVGGQGVAVEFTVAWDPGWGSPLECCMLPQPPSRVAAGFQGQGHKWGWQFLQAGAQDSRGSGCNQASQAQPPLESPQSPCHTAPKSCKAVTIVHPHSVSIC